MFEVLTTRFQGIFANLRSRGRLSQEDVQAALDEIRVALLDADVDLGVTKSLCDRIGERCVGIQLSKSISPEQQVIKAVDEELRAVLGGDALHIKYSSKPPTIILLVGLQGAGKTTAAAKLAYWFKQQGRGPMLVGTDLRRPAATEQLRLLGSQVGIDVFSEPTDSVSVAKKSIEVAASHGRDVMIVDTAGRHSIDEEMMAEASQLARLLNPQYTFLVLDAMTGQAALSCAMSFHDRVGIDGAILTKLDGDARGGAALSLSRAAGCPVCFVSTGERLEDFDLFHPDRMASRILGMGDILSLIETAERKYDAEVAAKAAEKLVKGKFTLDDFLEQLQQVKKLGSISSLLGMLPGIGKELKNVSIDDKDIARIEAVIHSMTRQERQDPAIINGSRRLRIAQGSGSNVTEVNQLLKQFKTAQTLMSSLGGGVGGRKGVGLLGGISKLAGGLGGLEGLGGLGGIAGGLGELTARQGVGVAAGVGTKGGVKSKINRQSQKTKGKRKNKKKR